MNKAEFIRSMEAELPEHEFPITRRILAKSASVEFPIDTPLKLFEVLSEVTVAADLRFNLLLERIKGLENRNGN
jgi:hypothetical protein